MRKLSYLLVIFIMGCGTTGIGSESEVTDYVMNSCGESSFISSIFTGDVSYCKATKKGDWSMFDIHIKGKDDMLTADKGNKKVDPE